MQTPADSQPLARHRGLTSEQVEASRAQHGSNAITPPPKPSWWRLYREKFDDPVIRILVVAAVIALVAGAFERKYAEAVGIIAAVFLATFLAFLNEYKAQKEFELLDRTSDEDPVRVIRDGHPTEVPKRDVVVGDVALIEIGGEPPADGRVIEAVALQVNEAPFTGESEWVPKVATEQVDPASLDDATLPPDRVYRGSEVTEGLGVIEVTEVGDHTQIGQMAASVSQESGVETPLNLQLTRLSNLIGVLSFIIAGALFVSLIARGVIVGELVISGSQWLFTGILFAAVGVALVRVWLPIVYDGLELLGKEASPPKWLGLGGDDDDEEEGEEGGGGGGLLAWALTMLVAVVIFGGGVGLAIALGALPSAPAQWLPKHVGEEFLKYFMIAVTLIVVAVPEGLAMSVTLSLAYSMRKLMADNNLVKRMHACETIGAATVIATDKTGTLTLNDMRVREAHFPCLNGRERLGEDGELTADEVLIVEAIAANSTGDLDRTADGPVCAVGNRTDCALLMWLDEQGIDYVPHRYAFTVDFQVPFDSQRKYAATEGVSSTPRQHVLLAKGAPDVVLEHCTQILQADGPAPLAEHLAGIEAQLHEAESRGRRCLGFAFHDAMEKGSLTPDELTANMTWLGFVATEDPVRPEVPGAVQACREAGIDVKIVTGDNPRTAREIARQVGLWGDAEPEDACMSGRDFWALDDAAAREAVDRLKILARARREHKQRLVERLQSRGEVVAFTGDGSNDLEGMHQAQVALAMGIRGTDAAKKVADIIIKDDSFTSVATGVMWGRALYQNIQRFILFQLTINVVACGIALLGPFIGVKLPLTVTQMLWVNLIMDTFAALALATEPPHREVMQRPPRDPEAFIITKAMAQSVFTVGLVFLGLLVAFLLVLKPDAETAQGRHDLSLFFSIFVMLQFWNLFNARCLGLTQSALRGMRHNRGFLVIATSIFIGQILFVQFGGEVFRTSPLTLQEWAAVIGGTSVVLWIGELWRLIQRLGRSAAAQTAA